ncbi:MAG: peptidoglycan DD-metalloendopeptidase family protein [Deltaproteobacteria bacterium]|nr:peptidoglycan DD-metalloendopeptidase family protein [Deltaproteobacteria bacterium]
MKKLLLKLLAFTLVLLFFLSSITPSFAESSEDLTQKLQEKQAEIEKLESILKDAQKKEKTLKSQLALIDGQTKVTLLKIEETNLKIEKLKREISELSTRIDRISISLDSLSELLLRRIVQTYKYSNTVSSFNLLFSSHGFADLVGRLKYIQVAQAYDKKKLYELQATKLAYNDQKQDKQVRQTAAEKLYKDLEVYKTQLAQQKKDKDELLLVTQNDEARYQQEIARLRADITSITSALGNIGAKIGPVNKGDSIAAMGSTGCSTGPHLHYEVYENAKVEGGKVVGTRTNPHNFLDNGKLGSPLRGYPDETTITTEFGEVYFLGTHTGLDIAPKRYEGVGRAILSYYFIPLFWGRVCFCFRCFIK